MFVQTAPLKRTKLSGHFPWTTFDWYCAASWLWQKWETDFYTPPVLRGAAFFTVQRQRCIKFRVLREQAFYTPLALNCQKEGSTSQHWRCIKIRSFEKGGQRGLARRDFPMPEIEASFLHPFSYAPLGEGGTHFWRTFWLVLGVCLVANPLRQPLFKPSEKLVS